MKELRGFAFRRMLPTVLVLALMIVLALMCVLGGTFLGWKVLAKPEPRPVLHTMLPPPQGADYDLKSTAPGHRFSISRQMRM